jgi:hypothetical protein
VLPTMACDRRPVELNEEPSKARLVHVDNF